MTVTPPEPLELGTPTALDEGRRKTRRSMAQVSFFILAVESGALWATLLVAPERGAVAMAFVSAWPVLVGTQGALLAIVLGYLGVSVVEKVLTK